MLYTDVTTDLIKTTYSTHNPWFHKFCTTNTLPLVVTTSNNDKVPIASETPDKLGYRANLDPEINAVQSGLTLLTHLD